MSAPLDEIESIGESHKKALAGIKITNLNHVLEECCTPEGRAEVSGRTGLSEDRLLAWAHLADFTRIPNIAAAYAQLLQAADVKTVAELARADAGDLATRLAAAKKRSRTTTVKRLPSKSRIEEWIADAKGLEKKVG
jgi:Domain of unknown function (DUF4332)